MAWNTDYEAPPVYQAIGPYSVAQDSMAFSAQRREKPKLEVVAKEVENQVRRYVCGDESRYSQAILY